jgi:hypothetical protein
MFFLFAHVDGKWEGSFDAGVQLGHVVVDVRLGDQCVGGSDVGDEVPEGYRLETLGGIVEQGIIYVVNCRCKLVACDGADDDVGIPCLAVGKVGSSSCFLRGCGSRWIERIFRWSSGQNDECGAVALEVKNWVLEEAKISFSVSPRARNGHEIGGEFLVKNLELLVGGLSHDAGECPVWHLDPDGLGRDSVRHSLLVAQAQRGGVR